MVASKQDSTFPHIQLTKPSPGCDIVVPEYMEGDEFLGQRYLELAQIHLESCDFCQRKFAGLQGSN